MSEAQLKRKRSQREKASATTQPKRPRTAADKDKDKDKDLESAQNTPTSTKTQTLPKSAEKETAAQSVLPPSASNTGDNALQVATTEGEKRSRRRGRRVRGDRLAVDDAQVADKPVTAVQKSAWSFSRPVGGRLIQHDAIFSQDESCVFASNGREIDVLAINTSLVERKLHGNENSATAFAASVTDSEELYVASSSGRVQRWDWTTGTPVEEPIHFEGSILALSVAASETASQDILYAICHNTDKWSIITGSRHIYTSQEPLQNLWSQGDYVVASTSTKLVVGKRIDEARYDFVEITITPGLTCLDCRIITGETKKKTKSESLTIALGNATGEIFLYENMSPLDKTADLSLTPRTLHWHRDAVASVKWSRDGNYLISGGKETVLVLWQLVTGKKQFLPHLTAEIERITVSPSGSSYAIQLADNSVMVLSTTELKPIANFARLQAQSASMTKSVSDHDHSSVVAAAAALNPLEQDQLLLSVPASASDTNQSTNHGTSRPFLQTYDLSTDRHVSRQALTRNNVTDFNKGPEGNKIRVPDVSLLQVSHDGQWLATVETWSPPYPDVEHLAADKPTNDEQRSFRREVYLKIWRRDAERNLWALETRIDSPHQLISSNIPGNILNLVADPVEIGFATIGEDSTVRIWKPKTRLRNGIVVRGSKAEGGLVDWSCRYSIPLSRSVDLAEETSSSNETPQSLLTPPKSAALAYSEDGSTLAVSQAFETTATTPLIHFINTSSGTISQTRTGLFVGQIRGLAFLDRHLIILSDRDISVWDIVTDTQLYCINLERSLRNTLSSILTTNTEDQTFAVALPLRGNVSRIQVFEPTSSTVLASQSVPGVVTALLSVNGGRGYKVLTNNAEIYTVTPRNSTSSTSSVSEGRRRGKRAANTSTSTSATAKVIVKPSSTQEIEDLDDEDVDVEMEIENNNNNNNKPLYLDDADGEEEADKPVVRPEQLSSIFDRDNISAMPVREMFDRVIGLFARKPRPVVVSAAV